MSNESNVATQVAARMGDMVNEDQISPAEVMIGASRAVVAFWMGCVQDGARMEALGILRQSFNEEIDNMVRGIANGMVPA